jgi:hypothetical protein
MEVRAQYPSPHRREPPAHDHHPAGFLFPNSALHGMNHKPVPFFRESPANVGRKNETLNVKKVA